MTDEQILTIINLLKQISADMAVAVETLKAIQKRMDSGLARFL